MLLTEDVAVLTELGTTGGNLVPATTDRNYSAELDRKWSTWPAPGASGARRQPSVLGRDNDYRFCCRPTLGARSKRPGRSAA